MLSTNPTATHIGIYHPFTEGTEFEMMLPYIDVFFFIQFFHRFPLGSASVPGYDGLPPNSMTIGVGQKFTGIFHH